MLLNYIKNNRNWKQMLEEQHIVIKTKIINNITFAIFTRTMECEDTHPVTLYCRGTIVDLTNMKIVCNPFKKFFNYGEERASNVDFSTATVYEKLDGSLIKVYHNGFEWMVATNGMLDARDSKIGFNALRLENFRELFDKVLQYYGITLKIFNYLGDENETYLFELCTPLNKVIIPHETYRLYFIGRILNDTGEELPTEQHEFSKIFSMPKIYNFHSLEDIIVSSEQLPYDEEGYIVKDRNNNRVKIKSLKYLEMHYLKGNDKFSSKKRIFNVIKIGEKDEVVSYFPEIKPYFFEIELGLDALKIYFDAITKILDRFLNENPNITKKDIPKNIFDKLNELSPFPRTHFRYIENREVDMNEEFNKCIKKDIFTYRKYLETLEKVNLLGYVEKMCKSEFYFSELEDTKEGN